MNFKIITVPHTYFAAMVLMNQLQRLGHTAKIVEGIDVYDQDVYIIYNASGIRRLPKRYIIQQTEISTSHWFTGHYLRTLSNAIAVWDYSEQNVKAYEKRVKNIAIVPPGIEKVAHNGKPVEFLFYGWIEGSERRARIIAQIKERMNIRVVTMLLQNEMWEILKQTKRVINVHFYDNSPLELYRLHESLSHGCEVFLWDEQREYTCESDCFEELKYGLKIAGI